MKKYVFSLVAALALIFPSISSSSDSSGIAVLSIRTGSGVSATAVARAESAMVKSIKASGSLRAMSISRRKDLLDNPGAPHRDCVTDECLIQAGRLLGVEWLIVGDVGKVGASYKLNLLLIETATGKVRGVYSRQSSLASLNRTAAEGARRLAGQAPGFDPPERGMETTGPSGTVVIETKPYGARAYIDAYLVGRTPTVAYRIPPGEHTVTLILDGHDLVQTTVDVKAGRSVKVDEILLMRTGSIEVASDPMGATVYLDGRKMGKTPRKLEGLLIGRHHLTLVLEGFKPLETDVLIEGNSYQKRLFTMAREGVMVMVTSQPEGARVTVDGIPVGATLYRGPVEPGKHTITVQLGPFQKKSLNVVLESGRSYAFHFRLAQSGGLVGSAVPAVTPVPGAATSPRPGAPLTGENADAIKFYNQASESGIIEDRIRLYRQSIAIDPNYVPAHNDLGVDLAELKRWDEAIAEYRKALSIDPNYAFAHNNLGHVYLNTGRAEDAIAELKAALALDPAYATARYNLGRAYFAQDRFDEALVELEAAIVNDPNHSSAYFSLGRTLKRLDRYEEALEAYLKCLEIDPAYFDAYFNLGDLYENMGEKESALYYYKKYIHEENRPGEEEWVEKARQRVRALGAN